MKIGQIYRRKTEYSFSTGIVTGMVGNYFAGIEVWVNSDGRFDLVRASTFIADDVIWQRDVTEAESVVELTFLIESISRAILEMDKLYSISEKELKA